MNNDEKLHIYYLPVRNYNSVIIAQSDTLDDLLTLGIQWKIRSDIMEYYNWSKNRLDYFSLGYTTQRDTSQCYFTSNSLEILDCSKAYKNVNNADMVLKNIQKYENMKWTADHLKAISPGYKTVVKEGRTQILNGNIVLYNPIIENHW